MSETPVVTNPLLSKIKLPGKIYQLPSKGFFYQGLELSPEAKDAEVHVHAMTALDEINMKNPDMLFSGKAIEAVCQSAVNDVRQPRELLSKDVDALMIFLRIVSYGQYFDVDITHTCKDAKAQTYTIDLEKMIDNMKYLDPTMIDSIFSLVLENGQKVRFQPVRYKHVLELMQNNDRKKEFTAEDIQNIIVKNVLNLIQSVDDITDPKLIDEWLRQIPARYMNRLADKVEQINDFGPNTIQKMKCKDCGGELDVELPLNPINFFSE